jgi:predicted O-methyltransferase YrrM
VEFQRIADTVRGLRNMQPRQGRRIYDHVRATRPVEILELGTSYGVSAAYMAAALDENGGAGRVTTVDHVRSNSPDELISRLEPTVAGRIDFVRIADSSYTWWLKERLAECTDADGCTEPFYDFCFLDGAHNWTIDGLAVVLVERLLKPGAWLLLDDLDWIYRSDPHGMRQRGVFFPLSDAERAQPHIRDVFELLVKPNTAFAEMRVEDDRWAWARKNASATRSVHVTTTRSLREATTILILRLAQRSAVTLKLEIERLRKLRGDEELIQREIEERATELARSRWIEEGYGGSQNSDEAIGLPTAIDEPRSR